MVTQTTALEDTGTDSQSVLVARIRDEIRRAMFDLVALAKLQGFDDQSTLDALQRLLTLGDTRLPYIELLKGVGLRAVRLGAFEDAMRYLQQAVDEAGRVGQLQDSLSRTAMRFLHDEEIDRALDQLSRNFKPVGTKPPEPPLKVAILTSAIIDENAPSIVVYKFALGLRKRGFDVRIVSTEYGNSTEGEMMRRVASSGVPTYFNPGVASGGSFTERVQALLSHFESDPVHTAYYLVTPMDNVAKLAGCIGLAPAQIWDAFAYEPHAGKYTFMCHGVSPQQESHTLWPGRSRYVGSFVAMSHELDEAVAYDRALLGLPQDAIVLSTFGRMEKCISSEYTQALSRILALHRNAYLVLAGPGSQENLAIIQSAFVNAGVADRVLYLGRRQFDGPALVKMTDVYCDTYPWVGGQTLLDAMYVGRPIVAMQKNVDEALDPTQHGATTNTAEFIVGSAVRLARAGNVDDYVQIASEYIESFEKRREDGALLHARAIEVADHERKLDNVSNLIREAIADVRTGS